MLPLDKVELLRTREAFNSLFEMQDIAIVAVLSDDLYNFQFSI